MDTDLEWLPHEMRKVAKADLPIVEMLCSRPRSFMRHVQCGLSMPLKVEIGSCFDRWVYLADFDLRRKRKQSLAPRSKAGYNTRTNQYLWETEIQGPIHPTGQRSVRICSLLTSFVKSLAESFGRKKLRCLLQDCGVCVLEEAILAGKKLEPILSPLKIRSDPFACYTGMGIKFRRSPAT